MTEETQHDLIDFLALAAIPTNEQKMLLALERIAEQLEVLVAVAGRMDSPKPLTAVKRR